MNTSQNQGICHVEIGALCQGAQTIERSKSPHFCHQFVRDKMTELGGMWRRLYDTSNGEHWYQVDAGELAVDGTVFLFWGSMGQFPKGTH